MKSPSKNLRITFRVDEQTNKILHLLASKLGIKEALFCRYAVMMMCEAYGFEQLGIEIPVAPEILCQVFHVDKDRKLVKEAVKLIQAKRNVRKRKNKYKGKSIHDEIEEEFKSLQNEGAQRIFEDDIRKRKI